MDSTACGIEGQLTNWNSHAVAAEVSEPENPFPIRHDHCSNATFGPVLDYIVDMSAIVDGNKESVRAAEVESKLLACLTYCGCVNDGQEFFCVFHQNLIEQTLVTNRHLVQVDVFAKICRKIS